MVKFIIQKSIVDQKHYNYRQIKSMQKPSVLIFLLLISSTFCTLVVRSPSSLKDYFAKKYAAFGSVPYSIANFGDVPYGRTIIGELAIPTVLQNCIYQDIPSPEKTKKIILSERNDCKFTQKALNTQKQGGIMSIIMDNVIQSPKRVIMIDDGHGTQIHIPTVLISKQDGEKILETMKNETVSISVSFDTNKSDTVAVNLYLDITDRNTFVFLRKLKPFFTKIKKHINLKLNYATIPCRQCAQSDCFYQNSYCKKIIYGWVPNVGQLFIKQQLREYFIFEDNIDNWWSYMDYFDEYCSETTQQNYLQDCSKNAMKAIGIDADKILKKVDQSFGKQDNEILAKSSSQRLYAQILYNPSVVVNNITYRGNLQAYEVYELVCNSLANTPSECLPDQPFEPTSSHIALWVILGVVGFLILLAFIIFCYRRIVRRSISNNMNKQVNELVNQYITMYEAERFKGDQPLKQISSEHK